MKYLGVDIGATFVKIGLVDESGQVLHKARKDLKEKSETEVVNLISQGFTEVLLAAQCSSAEIRAVGIGCPGQIEDGKVVVSANFDSWKNVPLRDNVEIALGVEVFLCNDADAAVAAEQWIGAAKDGVKDFVMITLGSGVGFGAVVNGKMLTGSTGLIEGGHMIINPDGRVCGCTQKGCLEAYSSANSVAKQGKQRSKEEGCTSYLCTLPEDEINAKEVFDAAKNGDSLALEIVEEAIDYLAIGCVNTCRILDPEMIVIAGGLAEAGDFLFDRLREAFKRRNGSIFPDKIQIVKASAGYDSGTVGAAYFALLTSPPINSIF